MLSYSFGTGRLKVTARTCAYCGKPKGCFAHVVHINGKAKSHFLHLPCVRKFIEKYGDK